MRDAEFPAGIRQRSQCGFDIRRRRRRDPDLVRLDVDAEPGEPLEVGKGLPADRDRAVGCCDLDVRDADAWLHSASVCWIAPDRRRERVRPSPNGIGSHPRPDSQVRSNDAEGPVDSPDPDSSAAAIEERREAVQERSGGVSMRPGRCQGQTASPGSPRRRCTMISATRSEATVSQEAEMSAMNMTSCFGKRGGRKRVDRPRAPLDEQDQPPTVARAFTRSSNAPAVTWVSRRRTTIVVRMRCQDRPERGMNAGRSPSQVT